MNFFARLTQAALFLLVASSALTAAESARQVIARSTLTEDAGRQRELVTSLMGQGDDDITLLLEAWRKDALFLFSAPDGTRIPVQLIGEKDETGAQAALRIDDGASFTDATGKPLRLIGANLTAVEHTTSLRRAMKAVVDLADLASDELIEIIGADKMDEDAANEVIMIARAHWFEDEDQAGQTEIAADATAGAAEQEAGHD